MNRSWIDSLLLHAALLIALLFSFTSPEKLSVPNKLVVRSVTLKPMETAPPQSAIEQPQESPIPKPEKPTPEKPTPDRPVPRKIIKQNPLLSEVIARLNKVQASDKQTPKHTPTKKIASVQSLNSDTRLVEQSNVSDDESCYISDLIRRIQLRVRLPEQGLARVRLTLTRKGKVAQLSIMSCSSPSIEKVLLERLPSVEFPLFGSNFKGESEHTFVLCLSSDLQWSGQA